MCKQISGIRKLISGMCKQITGMCKLISGVYKLISGMCKRMSRMSEWISGIKVMVKFTLEQGHKDQDGSRDITLFFL